MQSVTLTPTIQRDSFNSPVKQEQVEFEFHDDYVNIIIRNVYGGHGNLTDRVIRVDKEEFKKLNYIVNY